MSWFRKEKQKLRATDRRDLPTDVFDKCPRCGEILYRARLEQNLNVCPACGHHQRIGAVGYVELLADVDSFQEQDGDLRSSDPLSFTDLKPYHERIQAAERSTGRGEAVITGDAAIDGVPVSLAVMDFEFIGGSMGSVVGEKVARAARRSLDDGKPLVVVSASGGARMQEGILSLMQMAKTSVALAGLHEAGIPYLSVMSDPTTGGVTASYAMLGDVNIAEPGALIGFAGPRVIEQTIKQELPEGFQRSEFLLEHGMVDLVVDRREMKATVSRLLRHALALPDPADGPLEGMPARKERRGPRSRRAGAGGRAQRNGRPPRGERAGEPTERSDRPPRARGERGERREPGERSGRAAPHDRGAKERAERRGKDRSGD